MRYRWDRDIKAAHCSVLEGSKTVRLFLQGTSTSFVENPIEHGTHIIHIRIDKIPVRTAYYVGVALEKSFDVVSRSLRDVGWGLQDNGRGVMHEGEFVGGDCGGRGCVFNTGDVVTMIVVKEEGILAYHINQRPMVMVHIQEIQDAAVVWMGVTMYNQDAAMSILDSPSEYPMPDLSSLALSGVSNATP